MSKKKVPARTLEQAYEWIHSILTEARQQAFQAINTAMVRAYPKVDALRREYSWNRFRFQPAAEVQRERYAIELHRHLQGGLS